VGFGRGPFGRGPFGRANFGYEALLRTFPASYIEDDAAAQGRIIRYLTMAEYFANQKRSEIDGMDDLVDPMKMRADILKHLASTLATEIDDSEPVPFSRSLINNAVRLYQIKGTADSYRIRGKISGFDVSVFNLYRYADIYDDFIDPDNKYVFDNKKYTDLEPASVSGIPELQGCDYCFTSYIKIQFLVVKSLPASDAENFFDRLIRKLRSDVIPIHVRDVVYDLQLVILVDESPNLAASVSGEEVSFTPCHVFYRFDAVPADCVRLDAHGYLQGTVDLTNA
jgi:phage tail-like protein